MTTDKLAKGVSEQIQIDGKTITVTGIAKGSGMIEPNMATMLSYVFTDAAVDTDVLQGILSQGVEKSFNSITVDSDTSTSDTVLLFATGKAGNTKPTSVHDPILKDFHDAVHDVLLDLAHQIVQDGEGASKFVTITVSGAENPMAAKTIGLAIANSPLVKTAIAGQDANWGRIVMAVGKSGEMIDRDKLDIRIGGIQVTYGMRVDNYDEAPVAEHMKGQDILIQVDVGVGASEWTVWTCDLTHGYITINADYRS